VTRIGRTKLNIPLRSAGRSTIEAVAKSSPEEPWLADLYRDQPASRELYRDPTHGFVLLAHFEPLHRARSQEGRSRRPQSYALRAARGLLDSGEP
jgi:hypothetical protein